MKTLPTETVLIDVDAIRPFISRARTKAEFEAMTESIRVHGLKVPIEVRDITDEPAESRKRPEGGLYRFELVKGEGRTEAFRVLGKRKIPAYVVKAKQSEIAGRFLAENMIRKPLPWIEKARLVKAEHDAGKSNVEIAKMLFISQPYVSRLLQVASKTAIGLERDVAAMPFEDARELTELPAPEQQIVVEAWRENPGRQVREIVRKAVQARETDGELTATGLRASMKRVEDELKNIRESMKVTRLHHALGVSNIAVLLKGKKFRAALTAAGVNIARFEEVSSEA